jgi:hypothetical protein
MSHNLSPDERWAEVIIIFENRENSLSTGTPTAADIFDEDKDVNLCHELFSEQVRSDLPTADFLVLLRFLFNMNELVLCSVFRCFKMELFTALAVILCAWVLCVDITRVLGWKQDLCHGSLISLLRVGISASLYLPMFKLLFCIARNLFTIYLYLLFCLRANAVSDSTRI